MVRNLIDTDVCFFCCGALTCCILQTLEQKPPDSLEAVRCTTDRVSFRLPDLLQMPWWQVASYILALLALFCATTAKTDVEESRGWLLDLLVCTV